MSPIASGTQITLALHDYGAQPASAAVRAPAVVGRDFEHKGQSNTADNVLDAKMSRRSLAISEPAVCAWVTGRYQRSKQLSRRWRVAVLAVALVVRIEAVDLCDSSMPASYHGSLSYL